MKLETGSFLSETIIYLLKFIYHIYRSDYYYLQRFNLLANLNESSVRRESHG